MRADSEAISKGSVVLSNLVTSSNQRTVMLLAPETIFAGSSAVLQRRRFEPKEQRLNDIPSTDGVSGGIEEYTFASKPKKDSKGDGLSTLLPVCYASNTTCNEWTHSCSGHGYCYHKNEKSKKKGGSGADSKDCYACKCVQTVVSRHPDGRPKKTIQWGGPACQKKDVSTPFFIFASLTVLMVLGVSGAIGLLFNMGEEELPSVLSAGVTAKTRK
ncbi:hypothetical protein KEM55_003431 [Ascosphaera atra]|nr:hypothetical protein KEM55_003431 [Ascosphaera atra]